MSTDFEDAKLFGALEARVSALEHEARDMRLLMAANHSETMIALREMRSTLDRQDGGVKMLRWIGAGVIALSGWGALVAGWWARVRVR